ncbi:hypothetical protein LMH73_012415 [Vibrio splendidus]|nr:hypothetical protein [Vibrio splendidus]MCC4880702.1 hypothetical protein [Vibrio splendidus]
MSIKSNKSGKEKSKSLFKAIFSKDNRDTAKTWVEKFNDNLDKVTAFRDKIAMKSLVAWVIFGSMFILHHFDVMTTLAVLTQVLSAIYGVITGGIALAFFMAEFYVTAKVGAAVGLVVRNGFVADEVTDFVVDKFRNTKTQAESAKEAA